MNELPESSVAWVVVDGPAASENPFKVRSNRRQLQDVIKHSKLTRKLHRSQ
jgi:hypothetical protein